MEDLPLLVIAARQTSGRGRSGSEWLTADRALAASLAFRPNADDNRPLSLMAGVAAVRAIPETRLKWPNDVLKDHLKAGGILVEMSEGVAVVGLGLNLWWPNPPEGAGALFDDDPGQEKHAEIGALWGAELMRLVDGDGWPAGEYRDACETLGRDITWEPEGSGTAVEVAEDGSLVVHTATGEERLHSGAVHHIRD